MTDGLMEGPPFNLRSWGDPILSTPARDVGPWSEPEGFRDLPPTLLSRMREILKAHNGVGLAAQQVGSLWRVALLKLYGEVEVAINLRVVERSEEIDLSVGEGCLSVQSPSGEYFRTNLPRSRRVKIEYLGEDGARVTETLSGLEAIIAQHECDHLDGRCIVHGLSRQQRRAAERILNRVPASPSGAPKP